MVIAQRSISERHTHLDTHTHTFYSLFGAHDCVGISHGVFMTLAMMMIINVEIKKNREGQIIFIGKEETQFKKRISQTTVEQSGTESSTSFIFVYRF